jgi:hypothetical protein
MLISLQHTVCADFEEQSPIPVPPMPPEERRFLVSSIAPDLFMGLVLLRGRSASGTATVVQTPVS